jgi:hypothetical protein
MVVLRRTNVHMVTRNFVFLLHQATAQIGGAVEARYMNR